MALKLEYIQDESVRTMGTDSVVLAYSPSFVTSIKEQEVEGVLCHEILHNALMHPFRRGHRDHQLWNIACDYAVNAAIVEFNRDAQNKITMPNNMLYEAKYVNMSAEHIYEDLMNNSGGSASRASSSSSSKGQQIGDVNDFKASDAESEAQQRKVEMAIAQSVMAGKLAGKGSLAIEKLVHDIINPKLPWREILNRFITEKAYDDYSWRYPNKRYIHSGLYLPSQDGLKLKTIGIAVDTSGSINQKALDAFTAEIKSILSISPSTECEVVYVDWNVCGNERLGIDTDKLSPRGGGGTSYKPAFTYFDKLDEEVACIIYFTDGECSDWPKESSLPTLWLLSQEIQFNPPFGEVLLID